jgi:hypothetical protein
MTKSDKRRVLAALKRWEARYTEVDNDRNATAGDLLMAAVNWLRAMAKLGNEYIDDGADDWADENLVSAALLVLSECRSLQEEITKEAKNL